jgi:hypothetical protein
MNARAKLAAGVGAVTAIGAVGAVALAQGGGDFNGRLTGYQEVPALSTSGHGTFRASIRSGGSAIRYRLSYAGLEAKPLQGAHPPRAARRERRCDRGPAAQGIDFGELVRAIRAGATYANVHTEKYPGGEIRTQLRRRASSR